MPIDGCFQNNDYSNFSCNRELPFGCLLLCSCYITALIIRNGTRVYAGLQRSYIYSCWSHKCFNIPLNKRKQKKELQQMESFWNLCSGAHEIVVNIQSKPYRIYRGEIKTAEISKWNGGYICNVLCSWHKQLYHRANLAQIIWHNSTCAVKQRPTNLA